MLKSHSFVAILSLIFTCSLAYSCGDKTSKSDSQPDSLAEVHVAPDTAVTVKSVPEDARAVTHRVVSHIVPGRLSDIFCDSNHVQLQAAQACGFSPITDLRSAYHLSAPVVKVATTNGFLIESLSHSMPYLVPKASQLLSAIAHDFADTLRSRCGKVPYRIKVTSVMRTEQTVSELQRHNRNATTNSCHCYGTTFDISWSKFDCIDPSHKISDEDLKNILAEVVYAKRQQGLCFAKFERKQGCIHITVR